MRTKDTNMFRLCDPATQKFVELYELECLVAQAMDGQRSIDDLTAFARGYNPAIDVHQIELLVVQLLHLGLLEEEPIKPGHGKVIPLPVAGNKSGAEFSAFRNELVLDMQRGEALNWTDSASTVRRAPLFEAANQRAATSPGDDVPGLNASGVTVLKAGVDPFQVLEQNRDHMMATGETLDDVTLRGAPEGFRKTTLEQSVVEPPSDYRPTADQPAVAPPPEYRSTADQPAVEPPAPKAADEPPRTFATPRTAASEQEDLLAESQTPKKRWYQRTSIRILLVLVGVLLAGAIIHHPLYVTSECSITPTERVYVRSPINGTLAEILVDEGSPVHKGDVIARLDDRNLIADRRKAVAETERIQADLLRLQHGARPEEISQQRAVLAARRTALAFAMKEARRRAQMVKEGVGSRQSLDEAQLDLQIKQNAASEAAAALSLLEAGTRPEEVAALEAGLKRAKAELDFVEQKLADMVVIRAPIDGVVLTPKFRERMNESVEAGGLVCEIANMSTVRAEMYVLEREVDSVRVGMPVVVKVESYPLQPFQGKVDFIAPAVEIRDKISVVRVVAKLDNQQGLLRQDMTGYGEVECGSKSLIDLATRRILRWFRVRFLI